MIFLPRTGIRLEFPNTMWHAWNNMFLNVADKHAPKRVSTLKSPWITPQLKQPCIKEML